MLLSHRLTPTDLSVHDARQSKAAVSELDVHLEANGDYSAIVHTIDALAGFRPALLVDRADLSSQSGFAHFQLVGRLYCRATAQP